MKYVLIFIMWIFYVLIETIVYAAYCLYCFIWEVKRPTRTYMSFYNIPCEEGIYVHKNIFDFLMSNNTLIKNK